MSLLFTRSFVDSRNLPTKKSTIRQSAVFFEGFIVALITLFLRDWNAASMQTPQFLSRPFRNAQPLS